MKRKISLVIAFALSFLLMFSPIARAEETKFNAVTTSEPIEIEVVKTLSEPIEIEVVKTLQDTNKADSLLQEKVEVPVIDLKPISRGECVMCPGGWGHKFWAGNTEYCFRDCN